MKTSAFKIEMRYTCSQAWNDLPKRDGGLFCRDCSKVVQDFTKLSDEELIARLSQPPAGGLCGIFHKHQLEKIYLPVPSRSQRSWKALKVLLLGLFTLRLPMTAQEQTNTLATEQLQPGNKQQDPMPPGARKISGTISQAFTGKGMTANISGVGGDTVLKARSDSSGYFELLIPGHLQEQTFTLTVDAPGFNTSVQQTSPGLLPDVLNIIMSPQEMLLPTATVLPLALNFQRVRLDSLKIRIYDQFPYITGGVPMITPDFITFPNCRVIEIAPKEKPKAALRFTTIERLRNGPR